MRLFGVLAVLLTLAVPAQAYDQLAYYITTIGPEDLRNSRGVRLSDPAAVVQQDRANYHRFGIRHAGDEGDPVFGSRGMRAMIPGATRVFGAYPAEMSDLIRSGRPFRIGVFVCGTPGRVQNVFVLTPSIGDFSGCF
ncbi:hypothetical protein JANAI62_24080 [Jannaschia pagri]|uniref:Uncharacterized protein n=1 Tax=Jannaschia pagri TaxID=2829797 RepID=A0ABQ4NN12_9RHOB|nr:MULTISPECIES: hypothetical protein [unclassified Jannaschia]GIT95785.1 hypothetical protein JANAI62_24080 [Jannaschia sp. AI_62]